MIVNPGVGLASLRSAGTELVLDWRDGGVPAIAHWGDDLGDGTAATTLALARAVEPAIDLSHGYATPPRARLIMLESDAWKGRPGLAGHRADGSGWSPALRVSQVELRAQQADVSADAVRTGAGAIVFTLLDPDAQLQLVIEVELTASGLLRVRAQLRNDGADGFLIEELAPALPIPASADELLDFSGRWSRERAAHRTPIGTQTHLHESREGRTGFGGAPMLLCGSTGFDFAGGAVFGVHVAWSGNHRVWVEGNNAGVRVLAGGELLLPGEVSLAHGAVYQTPWVCFGRGDGLDAVAAQLHAWLRGRSEHPGADRPVTLNVWEAVYFDHDLDRLLALAEAAAEIGVERFVLDDGWFSGRRNDRAGLGDWVVDRQVWPDGLHPLVNRVRELGMEFGLWVEPEMVNPDSDLARAHPEWILATAGGLPVSWRHQQVLNLADPGAFSHVSEQLLALLDTYDIAYLKWDHNRELVSAGSQADHGRAGVHAQTEACYRLMDLLREAKPGLEIESCASGGGRIDLGMVEHAQRFWPSDCIDPLERHDIMTWTTQLLPLELLGAHISGPRSRTTGRVSTLAFRATGAMMGHFGIEWDLTTASATERAELAEWVHRFKRTRDLLFTGTLMRRDLGDGTSALRGVVAPDQTRALFSFSVLRRSDVSADGRVAFPGLDPNKTYRIRPIDLEHIDGLLAPPWLTEVGVELPGAVLHRTGIAMPVMFPEQSLLLEIEEVPTA